MRYEILYDGAFAMLKVELQRGERFKAESGAMVSMTPTVDLKGSAEGGMFAGFGRMLSGEKFFFQELTAAGGSAEILLSPSAMGDVQAIELDGSYSLYVQKDGFLAGTEGIQVNTKMQNLKKGLFPEKASLSLKSVDEARSSCPLMVRSILCIWPLAKKLLWTMHIWWPGLNTWIIALKKHPRAGCPA